MVEQSTSEAAAPTATQALCANCGNRVPADSAFCGRCGHPINWSADDRAAREHTIQPPPPPAHTMPLGSPPAYMMPPGSLPPYTIPPSAPGYLVPAQHPLARRRGTNTGLIVGLIAAGLTAVGLIVAVVLLASSGSGASPTVSTALTATNAIAPVNPSAGTTLASSGSGSSGSVSSASSLVPTPKAAAAAAVPVGSSPQSPSQPSAGIADANGARQVVERHWGLINAGSFSAAFALFVPGSQGDESAWIASHQKEAPISATVSVGNPTFNSPTDATVPLLSLHTVASDGCSNWTGSYDVQKVNGQWLINKASLQQQSC